MKNNDKQVDVMIGNCQTQSLTREKVNEKLNNNIKYLRTSFLTFLTVGILGGITTSVIDTFSLFYLLGVPLSMVGFNLLTNYSMIKENKKLRKLIKQENTKEEKEEKNKTNNVIEKGKDLEYKNNIAINEDNLEQLRRQSFVKIFDGERVNINPLTEIPKAKMKLYGVNLLTDSIYFENEEELKEYIQNNATSFMNTFTVEYLGNVAGRCDVIRKTYQNGKSTLYTAVDEDGYGEYNAERSIYKGKFIWEYQYGNIKTMYQAFRDRGIEFQNDVYLQIEEKDKQLAKMLRKN